MNTEATASSNIDGFHGLLLLPWQGEVSRSFVFISETEKNVIHFVFLVGPQMWTVGQHFGLHLGSSGVYPKLNQKL